jgi:hypothetical protein
LHFDFEMQLLYKFFYRVLVVGVITLLVDFVATFFFVHTIPMGIDYSSLQSHMSDHNIYVVINLPWGVFLCFLNEL